MSEEPAPDTWARFCVGPSTLGPSPGGREAWHRGRTEYAVWAFLLDDTEVVDRLRAVAAVLGPHGLRVELQPHLTVFVCGFPCSLPTFDDDVDEATLHAPTGPAPRLRVGGANSFLSCAILDVNDVAGDLRRLRAGFTGREIRFEAYRPHVTVGVYTDDRPTAPVADALAAWRNLPPIELCPTMLSLVTYRADLAGASLVVRRQVALERSR